MQFPFKGQCQPQVNTIKTNTTEKNTYHPSNLLNIHSNDFPFCVDFCIENHTININVVVWTSKSTKPENLACQAKNRMEILRFHWVWTIYNNSVKPMQKGPVWVLLLLD